MIFLFAFQLDWNLFWCVRDKVGIPLNLFPDRMTLNAAFFLCIFFYWSHMVSCSYLLYSTFRITELCSFILFDAFIKYLVIPGKTISPLLFKNFLFLFFCYFILLFFHVNFKIWPFLLPQKCQEAILWLHEV